jgi:hypothetical protein
MIKFLPTFLQEDSIYGLFMYKMSLKIFRL